MPESISLVEKALSFAGILFALLSFPLLIGRTRRLRLEQALLIASATVFVLIVTIKTVWSDPWDYYSFRKVGALLNSGSDPYVGPFSGTQAPALNPLPALPLFRLFALTSVEIGGRIWTVVLAALVLLLPYLGWRSLRPTPERTEAERGGPGPLFPYAVAAAVYCSHAALHGVKAGQLCSLVAAALFWSVWQCRRRPLAAGLVLSIVSMKPASLIPVLTQLLSRRFVKLWVGFIAGGLLLASLGTPPGAWPGRLKSNLQAISRSQEMGNMNDYTDRSPLYGDILSLPRLMFCLGLRDTQLISRLEILAMIALLGLLTWAARSPRYSQESSFSLVCLVSCFFMYHRIYDAILCVPALIHCSDLARSERGFRRGLLVSVVLGLLIVLNATRLGAIQKLDAWTHHAGNIGRVVQVTIVPFAMWILLWSVVVMATVAGRNGSGTGSPSDSDVQYEQT